MLSLFDSMDAVPNIKPLINNIKDEKMIIKFDKVINLKDF